MEVVRVGLAKVIGAACSLTVCAETGDYDELDGMFEHQSFGR